MSQHLALPYFNTVLVALAYGGAPQRRDLIEEVFEKRMQLLAQTESSRWYIPRPARPGLQEVEVRIWHTLQEGSLVPRHYRHIHLLHRIDSSLADSIVDEMTERFNFRRVHTVPVKRI